MARNKLNKFERETMFNTYIIKGVFFLVLVVNIVLPIYTSVSSDLWFLLRWLQSGVGHLFQLVIIGFHIYGLRQALGGGSQDQTVPLLPIVLIRLAELAWHQWIPFSGTSLNWTMFGIVMVCDLLFFVIALLDKGNYRYGFD